MATRSKTRWTPDTRGRYTRRIGWKKNTKGQLVQHLFYLGTDLTEAKHREDRLVEFWQHIEKTHRGEDQPLWNSLTLKIGKELAKGNRCVVIERNGNSPEAFARYLHRLSRDFPMVYFVPDEPDAYQDGRAKGRAIVEGQIGEIERFHRRSGNIAPDDIPTATEMLHEAIDCCIEEVKQNYLLPGSDDVTAYGQSRIANLRRIKERHDDVPLSSLSTYDAVQAMLNLWRNRPIVKNSDPPRPVKKKTAQHHVAELMRFLRWLNRSARFDWRKPEDFDELETRIAETPKERQERLSPTKVQTYSIDELRLLNEYATPLERLLLLLGLNCGFGASEQGQWMLNQIYLNQPHPRADLIRRAYGIEPDPHDSFIVGARPKNGVHGEWLLWPQTVEVLKWARDRRERIGNAGPDSVLLVTERGRPFFRQTAGGNRAQSFSRRWCDLTSRIQADYPDFPHLSFGKLRKTASSLVRRFASGETARTFLCHGRPVPTDDLLDLYTHRPFDKVFQALRDLEAELAPVFDAAPENLFAQPTQQYTGLKKVKSIMQLHGEGKSVREIATQVGISKSAVYRHIEDHRRKSETS